MLGIGVKESKERETDVERNLEPLISLYEFHIDRLEKDQLEKDFKFLGFISFTYNRIYLVLAASVSPFIKFVVDTIFGN